MAFRGNGLNDIYDNDLEVKKRLTTRDGTIYTTPVNNLDIVNKKYVDDAISGFTPITLPLSHTDSGEITDVGTNTHTQIDTHIASTAIHFTAASVDHTAIQNIGTNSHPAIDTHIASQAIHFTQASIDHTAITNIGTNSHATIDSHIADTSDPHGTLLTQTYLNVASCAITADNTTVSQAFVRNIVFGTSATPPTASNFTQGTIYMRYTP